MASLPELPTKMEPKMEPKMIKFPSIEQPRQVLPHLIRSAQFTHIDQMTKKPCYKTSAALPVLEFQGTVKLHGSNAAIVQKIIPAAQGSTATATTSVHFQSRERILSIEKDLMGFCAHMSNQKVAITRLFESISSSVSPEQQKRDWKKGSKGCDKGEIEHITIFGEWCGTGIQKGVAISKLPKMFVIFAVKVIYCNESTPAEFIDISKLATVKEEDARIFNITQFPTYSVIIDFNKEDNLKEARTKMDALTLAVEEECPVGKYFNVSGTGEGIVWRPVQSPDLPVFRAGYYLDSRFWFKTKGVKHNSPQKSVVAHKGVLATPKATAKMDAFVELVLTQARLEQGLQVLERELCLPIEIKSVGAFLKWVNGDVVKEEYDRIEEAGIDKKVLPGFISAAAKTWFCNHLKEIEMENLINTLTIEP